MESDLKKVAPARLLQSLSVMGSSFLEILQRFKKSNCVYNKHLQGINSQT